MTVANILIYVALIGYILHKRVGPLEITLTAIGRALSLGFGAFRGRADKLSTRDGSPFVQWGAASLIPFAGNIVVKLVLDLIGIAAGAAGSVVGKSLVFTFGLTLLGEATVIWTRTGGPTGLLDPASASRSPSLHE